MKNNGKPTAVSYLNPGQAGYPQRLAAVAGGPAPRLTLLGEVGLLERASLGVLCSIKCPGALILRTYDFIGALKDEGQAAVGGFHSPMEQECLRLLLRNGHPAIIFMARNIEKMCLPAAWSAPLEEKRLLVVCGCDARHRRVTVELAETRNSYVATLAQRLFVPHASPGGKTEALCQRALAAGKPIVTFDSPDNSALIALGAKAIDPSC